MLSFQTLRDNAAQRFGFALRKGKRARVAFKRSVACCVGERVAERSVEFGERLNADAVLETSAKLHTFEIEQSCVQAAFGRLGDVNVACFEIAVIDGSPRSATAVAKEATELELIDGPAFALIVERSPSFALKIMRMLAARIRRMNDNFS